MLHLSAHQLTYVLSCALNCRGTSRGLKPRNKPDDYEDQECGGGGSQSLFIRSTIAEINCKDVEKNGNEDEEAEKEKIWSKKLE